MALPINYNKSTTGILNLYKEIPAVDLCHTKKVLND